MPKVIDFQPPIPLQWSLWQIAESPEDLLLSVSLSEAQKEDFKKRKTKAGQQGFLAARLALHQLTPEASELQMNENGVPTLPHLYCSLSHTAHYAVAVVAEEAVGVDIESYRPKIERIAQKFTHPKEIDFLPQTDKRIEMLTRLWTAKEAIYKAVQKPGLSLSNQIQIAPFSLASTSGNAEVFIDNNVLSFTLNFSTFNEHELTFAKQTHP